MEFLVFYLFILFNIKEKSNQPKGSAEYQMFPFPSFLSPLKELEIQQPRKKHQKMGNNYYFM